MAVGKLVIGTAVDTTGIDKGIKNIEKKMDKVRSEIKQEVEIDGATAYGTDIGITPEQQAQLESYEKTLEELYEKREAMMNAAAHETQEIIKQQQVEQVGVQAQTEQLSKEELLLQKMNERWMGEGKLVYKKKEELGVIEDITKEEEEQEKAQSRISQGLTRIIRKIGKWALAVIGIRSVYSSIRSAMGIISQYDKQMAADFEYIRYALAMSLKPLIEWVMGAIRALMYYAGYIAKAWFNIDLWANSSAKGMASASKSAKELKKSVASFDDANILGSTNATDGSGSVAPSFDASEWDYTKAEEMQKNFIEKSKNDWLELEETMRGAIEDPEAMKSAFGNWSTFMEGLINIFLGAFDIVKGVIETIIGIVQMVVGVFTGNFDLIKKGWDTLISGISNILYGLIEIVAGVLQTIWGIVEGVFLDLVIGIYETVIKPIGNFFVNLWNGLVSGANLAWEGIKNVFSTVASFFKDTFSKAWEGVKSLFSKGGKIFDGVKDGIVNAFKTVVNVLITGINKAVALPFNAINKFLNKIRNISFLDISPFKGLWEQNPIKIPQIPKLATGGIVDVPRTGINIGRAIVGEAGKEGVLPLTNPNTMAELGKEIGKWITLNIDLTNTIDGRVLNKRLEQLNADKDFARNGVR